MVCEPAFGNAAMNTASPLFKGTTPALPPLIVNVTVPVAKPFSPVTVATNVTT